MTTYTEPPRPGQQFMDSRNYNEPSAPRTGAAYDGSQKDMFMRSVELRIEYLEDLLSRLPNQIGELQMQQKIYEEELTRLYGVIPKKLSTDIPSAGALDYNRIRR